MIWQNLVNNFGQQLFIWFIVPVFRERLSICVCASFPYSFEGRVLDLIVLVLDHCH